MKFEAHVSDDFMVDGVAIYVSLRRSAEDRSMVRVDAEGRTRLEAVEPLTAVEPTMRLNGEAARALLEALQRFYQGSADTQALRSDLLHERGRVDKLTDAIIGIARKDTP